MRSLERRPGIRCIQTALASRSLCVEGRFASPATLEDGPSLSSVFSLFAVSMCGSPASMCSFPENKR